ncbi:MAG: YraN family protein [Pirellulales bacterium]
MGVRTWWASRFRAKPLGARGEDLAARFLKRRGYRILGRQVDSRHGEIDIVAVDGRTIVFVEVKTRQSTDAGHPTEAIDEQKQERLTRAALAYLKAQRLLKYAARFDVVAITWPDDASRPTIEHYRDAFPAVGAGQFFN